MDERSNGTEILTGIKKHWKGIQMYWNYLENGYFQYVQYILVDLSTFFSLDFSMPSNTCQMCDTDWLRKCAGIYVGHAYK